MNRHKFDELYNVVLVFLEEAALRNTSVWKYIQYYGKGWGYTVEQIKIVLYTMEKCNVAKEIHRKNGMSNWRLIAKPGR